MVGSSRPRMLMMAAAAAGLGALVAGPGFAEPVGHTAPPRPKTDPRKQERRAWERRRRKKAEAEAELRERLLRQRIAEGKDDRPDKYLHAAARRRRGRDTDAG